MEKEIRQILEDNFMVPETVGLEADLREYLEDSIDVGEFVAICNSEIGTDLKIIDFRGVHTLSQVLSLIEGRDEA